MSDEFDPNHPVATGSGEIGEISVEPMSVPLRDTEYERLEEIRRELDEERQKFAEAALQPEKEREGVQ
ncbi:hypothetical protein H0H93_005906, partial [Arthromyces matolae]